MNNNSIDWNEQWALNAPFFENGRATIALSPHVSFELLPGGGFGDYSHPTTQLMLEMMPPFVEGKSVFDIGCGSGILSIAAQKLKAKEVFCCDIDPEAVAHTKKNAFHNTVSLHFKAPSSCDVVLMNMIECEQQLAWSQNHCSFNFLMTSGILAADKERYLTFAKTCNWNLLKQFEKNDWCGFVFTN